MDLTDKEIVDQHGVEDHMLDLAVREAVPLGPGVDNYRRWRDKSSSEMQDRHLLQGFPPPVAATGRNQRARDVAPQ